jgi:hypothetical protein
MLFICMFDGSFEDIYSTRSCYDDSLSAILGCAVIIQIIVLQ